MYITTHLKRVILNAIICINIGFVFSIYLKLVNSRDLNISLRMEVVFPVYIKFLPLIGCNTLLLYDLFTQKYFCISTRLCIT